MKSLEALTVLVTVIVKASLGDSNGFGNRVAPSLGDSKGFGNRANMKKDLGDLSDQ